jgi:hypothetical protein
MLDKAVEVRKWRVNLLLTNTSEVCSWGIVSSLRLTQNQENGNVDQEDDEGWHKGGNEARDGGVGRFLVGHDCEWC